MGTVGRQSNPGKASGVRDPVLFLPLTHKDQLA